MLPNAYHMYCPSHNHSFVLPKTEVKLGVHHCAVLTSLLLLPYCPNSIHCPQHPFLRHTLSNVLLLIRETKLYTHNNNKGVVQHRPFQRTVPFRGPLKHFATCYVLLWAVVTPHQVNKLEYHPFSAVRDSLFKIFAATLNISKYFLPSATSRHVMSRWLRHAHLVSE
jgi:hypothetical protein